MFDDWDSGKKKLDATLEIVAPENVAFEYRLAGPFTRAAAFAIDSAIIAVEIAAVAALCVAVASWTNASRLSTAFFLTNFIAVFWFWNAAFEAFWNGRTIGKATLGLRVLTIEGRPIGRGQALLRNVLRAADLALGPFLAIVFCWNGRFARFGDLAAGSIVVVERKTPKKAGAFEWERAAIAQIAASLPVDFEVSDSLSKALALYVERRTEIAPRRLVAIAAPLAAALAATMNFSRPGDPDLFLRAVFLRTFGAERA